MRWPFGRRRDDELREELASHLRMSAADRMERGDAPDEARQAARREFGNVGLIQEMTREFWGWRSVERLAQDVRVGLRLMRRRPGFAALAVGCLALGIGVTTTIFTAVSGLLLHPLPYANADRLVVIHSRDVKSDRPEIGAVSWADVVTWRRENHTLATIGVWSAGRGDLIARPGDAESVLIGNISPGVVEALGLVPVAGRAFEDGDQKFGNHFVAILSHAFWLRRFGGADVVGQTLKIEQLPAPVRDYRIVGILPSGATFPENVDLFVPAQMDADEYDAHGSRNAQGAIARLKPGVGIEQARSDIGEISRRLNAAFPKETANRLTTIRSLREELAGDRRTTLLLLQGAAALVLFIACTNVAQLNLARAAARRRELSVRTAIGASRLRVLRQLLTESLLLAAAGGVAGIALALYGSKLLVLLLPGGVPGYAQTSVDATVLLFCVGISIVTGVISGVLPAIREARAGVASLRSGPPGSSDTGGSGRTRQILVVTEVALAFVLVIGAALVVRSNAAIDRELRFDRSILWFGVPTPAAKYEGGRREIFFEELVARIRAIPGVESVGRAALGMPLGRSGMQRLPIAVAGDNQPPDEARRAVIAEIDPQYLQTLGVPLVRGRAFAAEDRPAAGSRGPFAAVVNETFVRRYLGDRNPVTQTILAELPGARNLGVLSVNVVGVFQDYRQDRPPVPIPPTMYVYVPLGSSNTPIVVRASGDTDALVTRVRAVVRQMDQDVRVTVDTFDHSIALGLAGERLYQRVLSLFGILALTLAVVGVYGVAAYDVSQRTREFGIRVALGAAPRQLFRTAVGQGVRGTALGLAIGAIAAWWLTSLLGAVLYGVQPRDAATFMMVAGVLAVVCLAAGIVPARRASRVDPLIILKTE